MHYVAFTEGLVTLEDAQLIVDSGCPRPAFFWLRTAIGLVTDISPRCEAAAALLARTVIARSSAKVSGRESSSCVRQHQRPRAHAPPPTPALPRRPLPPTQNHHRALPQHQSSALPGWGTHVGARKQSRCSRAALRGRCEPAPRTERTRASGGRLGHRHLRRAVAGAARVHNAAHAGLDQPCAPRAATSVPRGARPTRSAAHVRSRQIKSSE